jgi:hypothetical protein
MFEDLKEALRIEKLRFLDPETEVIVRIIDETEGGN